MTRLQLQENGSSGDKLCSPLTVALQLAFISITCTLGQKWNLFKSGAKIKEEIQVYLYVSRHQCKLLSLFTRRPAKMQIVKECKYRLKHSGCGQGLLILDVCKCYPDPVDGLSGSQAVCVTELENIFVSN